MVIDAFARVSPTEYGAAENYVEQLSQGGIQRGVVCPGGMVDVRRMNAYVAGEARPDTTPNNDYVDRAVRANPGLHALVAVDPCAPDATALTERHLRRGCLGAVISPLVHQFSFSDSAVADLASFCGDAEVPLYAYVARRPGATTADYAGLARRFPRTHFILQHMGAQPADHEASAAAAELDNLFLETSLGSYLHILQSVRQAGAGKVIFGSEYPLSHPLVELQKILLLPIPEGEREKILCGNIRALLHLERA